MFQHASGNKEDYYGSIEGQTLPGNNDVPVDDVTSTTDTASKMKKFAKYALIVAIGSSAMYALSFSRPRSSTEVPTLATTNDVTNSADHLALPDYLVALDSTDPEYDESMLTSKYVIGEPGQGNMIPGEVELVRFVKEHFVFRTYGGGAKQCGYWWVLNPPKGSKETYFDHFAICPEWNDADNIVRCRVPVNYTAVVGIGQTVSDVLSSIDANSHLRFQRIRISALYVST